MPRVSVNAGPSNADTAKELPVLIVQGKIRPGTTTPIDWINWKP